MLDLLLASPVYLLALLFFVRAWRKHHPPRRPPVCKGSPFPTVAPAVDFHSADVALVLRQSSDIAIPEE